MSGRGGAGVVVVDAATVVVVVEGSVVVTLVAVVALAAMVVVPAVPPQPTRTRAMKAEIIASLTHETISTARGNEKVRCDPRNLF